jgi:hypothetical protein
LGQGLDLMVPARRPEQEWDGFVPAERLTCGWVRRSHSTRERKEKVLLFDF